MGCPFLRGEISLTGSKDPVDPLHLYKIVAALAIFVVTLIGAMLPFLFCRLSTRKSDARNHEKPISADNLASSAKLSAATPVQSVHSGQPFVTIMNALASGSLVGLVLLHMLPEVISTDENSRLGFSVNGRYVDAAPLLLFLGFSLMLLCEKCVFEPWGICPHSHCQTSCQQDNKAAHQGLSHKHEHHQHSGCKEQHCCFDGHQEPHVGSHARGGRPGSAPRYNYCNSDGAAISAGKAPHPSNDRSKGPVSEEWPSKPRRTLEDSPLQPLPCASSRNENSLQATDPRTPLHHFKEEDGGDDTDSELVLVPLLDPLELSKGAAVKGSPVVLRHSPSPTSREPTSAAGSVSILATTLGLTAHSVVEGLLVGLATSPSGVWTLTAFICSHEWMTAFAMSNICIRKRASRAATLLALLLFIGASPIGVLVGMAHIAHLPVLGSTALVAVSTGIILYTSAEITFETFEVDHHSRRVGQQLLLLAAFIAGASVIALVAVVDALINPRSSAHAHCH